MARSKKKKPENLGDFIERTAKQRSLMPIIDVDAYRADRRRRGNPAYSNSYGGGSSSGNGSGQTGPVNEHGYGIPQVTYDPVTNKVIPAQQVPGTAPVLPTATSGSGRIPAAAAVVPPAQSSAPPKVGDIRNADGRSEQELSAPEENFLQTGFKNTTHWLSDLFNPDDEKETAVESVWDWAIGGLGMMADTVNWGVSGALLAANPHYWENRDAVGMEGNLWQDATRTSAGRAFQGFVSPVQDVLGQVFTGENQGVYSHYGEQGQRFDISDEQHQKAWFDNSAKRTLDLGFGTIDMTPQNWGSGIGDAVVATYLDPTNVAGIGIGKLAKFSRVRYLNGAIRTEADTARVVTNITTDQTTLRTMSDVVDVDEFGAPIEATRRTVDIRDLTPDEVAAANLTEEGRLAWEVTARKETAASIEARTKIDDIVDPAEKQKALDEFVPEYEKRMRDSDIYNHQVIENATNRDALTAALYNADDMDQAALILRHAAGDKSAAAAMNAMVPHLYKTILDGERRLVERMLLANPELVGGEIARWQGKYEHLVKRLDDLEELRADPTVLADVRAQLDDAMDMWQYAQDATVPAVGMGPAATADEISLMRRALDTQLTQNDLFIRSLTDAGGDTSSLAGALVNQSNRGFTRLGQAESSMFGDTVLGRMSEAGSTALGRRLGQGVQSSRLNRAKRKSIAQTRQGRLGVALDEAKGAKAKAKVLGQGFLNNWKVDEFYGIRPTAGLGTLAAPIARVFRWMPTERQGFTIQTSGVGAQESAREIRAMLNGVDIYSGKPKTVIVHGKEMTVGGLERKEALIQQYQNAMLLGGDRGDMLARKLIDDIEEQMLNDIAYYHGLDPKLLKEVHYRQNRQLEKIEKEIREEGYWVDEKGSRNYAPYLSAQLQNGAFLKNWREINRMAGKYARREWASAPGATTRAGLEYRAQGLIGLSARTLGDLNSVMQDFWRPAVLLRLGYTQRNVAEGLFRSTAFQWSLMPIVDAGHQIGLSTGNVVRRFRYGKEGQRGVLGQVGKADDFADMPPRFKKWYASQVEQADNNIATTRSVITDTRRGLADTSEAYRVRRTSDLNDKYAHVLDQQRTSREHLDALDMDEAAMTARQNDLLAKQNAGKLTKKEAEELDGLPSRLKALWADRAETNGIIGRNTERLTDYADEMTDLSRISGGDTVMTSDVESLLRTLDDMEEMDLPFHQSVRTALDDPKSAALAFRSQTMAKRRVHGKSSNVGDPDSVASVMREKALGDPWAADDSYADIAWQNMSADHTMRQTAAMRMKAVGDSLAAQEMRYYVEVKPGDANYFDGVASVLNQFQNSEVGKFVIAGRAAGKGDQEIVDDIVRWLYETGDGQETATFINQANDIAFGGAFESSSRRTAEALRKAIEDTKPLAEARDQAYTAWRSVNGQALAARNQLPKPRFAGDTGDIPKRVWAGDKYGDHEVVQVKRGQYEILDGNGNVVGTATSRRDARAAAKQAQVDADDVTRAHWEVDINLPSGQTFRSAQEIDDYVAASRKAYDDARDLHDASFEAARVPKPRVGDDARRLNTGELEDARYYAEEVLRRYDVVTNGDEALQQYLAANPQLPIGGGRHATTEAGDIVREFLDGQEGLQQIIGNTAVFVGEKSAMEVYRGITTKLFRALGTIPEDLMVRGPFYGRKYKEQARLLYDNWVAQAGDEGLSWADVNMIREQAHRRALKDTKDWLYTIDRRTSFADSMEKFVPFVTATQNSVTTVGKLIWRDPAVAAAMNMVWKAPDWMFGDEDGNPDTVAIPTNLIPGPIKDMFGIDDKIEFNKRQGDLIFSGVFDPQGPPIVGISSSELMKSGMFGAGEMTPEWMDSIPGGDVLWNYWKDYSLGKDGGSSEYFASIDRMLAPWQKRMFDAFILGEGSSAAFGKTYQSMALAEEIKYRNGEREDPPTHEEIMGTARAATTLRALANLTLFTTPKYDTASTEFARQVADHDSAYYKDQARIRIAESQAANGIMVDPGELEPLVEPSEEFFGSDMLVAAARSLHSVRANTTGVAVSALSARLAQENSDVVGAIAPSLLADGDMSVLGILTQDTSEWYTEGGWERTDVAENPAFSQDAQAFFMSAKVPGTSETWKGVTDPRQAALEEDKQIAWRKYMVAVEAIELEMRQRGIGSFESREGALYKDLKQAVIDDIDADHKGWRADFIEQQPSRTNSAIRVLTEAFNTPAFNQRNEGNSFWAKSGPAYQYLTQRNAYIDQQQALVADAKANGVVSLDSKAGEPWRQAIEQNKANWKATQWELRKSPTWAAIQDRYIGDDDVPKEIGVDSMLTEYTEEAS